MYDITFIGHVCYDEIVPFCGEIRIAPGSAVLCGALAAARIGKKVAVITKLNPKDAHITKAMTDAGVEVYAIPSKETSYMKVIHSSANVDERQLILTRNAGFFMMDEMPPIHSAYIHLAGISDREFTLDFIQAMSKKYAGLSADMQGFVRQTGPSGEVAYGDCSGKREIVRLLDKVKLDVVEARLLTGRDDIFAAVETIEGWGCREIVITQAEGVHARCDGRTYYEKFTNKSDVGRTGRGDTTFAAYLARRMDHGVSESLRFAAALVSIKMETPGPYRGTLEDVLQRVRKTEVHHANDKEA